MVEEKRRFGSRSRHRGRLPDREVRERGAEVAWAWRKKPDLECWGGKNLGSPGNWETGRIRKCRSAADIIGSSFEVCIT